jgi:hypothetical protein
MLKRRVRRLEERSGINASQPRKVVRIVVRRLDRDPSPEAVECKKTLCPDGSLIEVVRLGL